MEAPTTGQKKKKKKETQAAQLAGIVCSVLYWSVANLLINGRDKCVMADPLSLATHTHTVHKTMAAKKKKKRNPCRNGSLLSSASFHQSLAHFHLASSVAMVFPERRSDALTPRRQCHPHPSNIYSDYIIAWVSQSSSLITRRRRIECAFEKIIPEVAGYRVVLSLGVE